MPAPTRILFVQNTADLYGGSRCLLRLIQGLDRREFQACVVLPEEGPLRGRLEAEGVDVILHPQLSIMTRSVIRSWRLLWFGLCFPFSALFLRGVIRGRKIDVVHTNTGVIVSPALAAWLAGVPHLWHIREWFQEFRSFWKPYAAYIQHFSRRILAVSSAMAEQFPDRSRVEVVHDGFPIDEFIGPHQEWRAAFRARFGLGDSLVVGCVGRIKLVRKGQEVLMDAAGRLRARGRSFRCVIVGSVFPGNEDHLTQLRRQAETLGIAEWVIFTGELPDARPAYAAMDVLVLPSAQPEPFGGVVIEAMAMGLPVIATAIGGSVEQVVHGETGFLVPAGDADALADRIDQLIQDPALRSRMGAAGQRRMHARFTRDVMCQQTAAIYRQVLASATTR